MKDTGENLPVRVVAKRSEVGVPDLGIYRAVEVLVYGYGARLG